jgi:hypothetical protein
VVGDTVLAAAVGDAEGLVVSDADGEKDGAAVGLKEGAREAAEEAGSISP